MTDAYSLQNTTNVFRSWHELAHVLGFDTDQLAAMGEPKLIATPPFHIGQEVAFDPLQYKGFMGYLQKMDLLPVQKAILSYLLAK